MHLSISWCDWDGNTDEISSIHSTPASARIIANAIIAQQHPFVLAVHKDGVPLFVYAPMDIHQ